MPSYLLGLDNGNTVTKAALFDLTGREIGVAAEPVQTRHPAPGHVERDMTEVWQQTALAIRQVLQTTGIAPGDIAAIGCSGQGNGVYLLDHDQQPLFAIPSMDSRATELVAEWQREGRDQAIYPINYQGIWSAQTGMLLAWLKRFNSVVYEQIGTAFFCKDYINFCLTGVRATDVTDASGGGLMDVKGRQYSDALLRLYGMPEAASFLPPLCESADIVGTVTSAAAEVTGLNLGTPVIAGLFDVVASALGAGVVETGDASIIAGTWSINQVIVDQPIANTDVFMSCVFDRERYIAIESSATSATNLEWFVNECLGLEKQKANDSGRSVFETVNQLVASTPVNASLPLFHPFLHGTNAHPGMRAGFYGISGGQGKGHLLRSLYEGVAFGHLNHINQLRQAGADFKHARLTGGGSRSHIWAQMFADILEIPIDVPTGIEIGARGAAMAAGVGVGLYRDLAEGVSRTTAVERHHAPDSAKFPCYRGRYQRYQLLTQLMAQYCEAVQQLDTVSGDQAVPEIA